MKKILIVLFSLIHIIIRAQGWQDESLSIGSNLNAIHFIDINHGWIVGDSGLILKYHDHCWTRIESEFSNYNLTELYFTDSVHGWIIGESGIILEYNNDTISMINSPTNKKLNDIYMINENYGWIGGDDRTILKYSEKNWSVYPTDSFSGDLNDLSDIQFIDSTFGIFIGGYQNGFTILNYVNGEWHEDNDKTNTVYLKGLFIRDKENIFTSVNQQLPGNINWGSFINYNSITGTTDFMGSIGEACYGCEIDFGVTMGWAISRNHIFKYKNNGFVIYDNHKPIIYPLNSICIINDSIGWIVGDKGTILYFNSQISNIPEIDNTKLQVYPNPFQDYLFINSAKQLNKIEIYSTEGTKIRSLSVYNDLSIELNCGDLPRGIYILQIIIKDSVFVRKIIKK